jgi:hypothetical protein
MHVPMMPRWYLIPFCLVLDCASVWLELTWIRLSFPNPNWCGTCFIEFIFHLTKRTPNSGNIEYTMGIVIVQKFKWWCFSLLCDVIEPKRSISWCTSSARDSQLWWPGIPSRIRICRTPRRPPWASFSPCYVNREYGGLNQSTSSSRVLIISINSHMRSEVWSMVVLETPSWGTRRVRIWGTWAAPYHTWQLSHIETLLFIEQWCI